MQEDHNFKLRTALTKTQLAKAYGVNIKTFNKWIKPALKVVGNPFGRLFTPLQVKTIIQMLGRPPYPERL